MTTMKMETSGGAKGSPKAEKKSTRHVKVDVFRAEYLAKLYPLSVVEIRECLEGEPLKKAIGLILWVLEKAPRDPYRKLCGWACRNQRGFYSRKIGRRNASEEYGLYLKYLEAKRAEKEEKAGQSDLLPSEIERATRDFYAPRTRAEMARISEAVWDSYHRELEEEEEEGAA